MVIEGNKNKIFEFMLIVRIYFFFSVLFLNFNLFASNNLIIIDKKKVIISIENIFLEKNLEKLSNVKIQAYPRRRFNIKAIKICNLLKLSSYNKKKIKITAKDNFFIYLVNDEINNCSNLSKIPYIAIENKKSPWPKLIGNHEKVGTFSLIWIGNNAMEIAKEKWIRNISSIEILKENEQVELKSLLPASANTQEKNGFKVYEENCSPCHSLNLVGQHEIGPDLNYPNNPLEYFSEKILRQFIRDPQSIHYYKNAKMEGFDSKAISEKNLNDLINFMRLVSHNKITSKSFNN